MSSLSLSILAPRPAGPQPRDGLRRALRRGGGGAYAAMIHELSRLRGLQVPLGLERGHAAGGGGSHRLAVDVVLDVPRGEHTGHRRLCRPGDDFDVVIGQELNLLAEDLGVRTMTDRDEETVDRTFVESTGL